MRCSTSVAVMGFPGSSSRPSTVAAVRGSAFTVALIPYTLERTNLHAARPGTRVNLEVDVIAKYVERLMGSPHPGRSKRPGRARKRP